MKEIREVIFGVMSLSFDQTHRKFGFRRVSESPAGCLYPLSRRSIAKIN